MIFENTKSKAHIHDSIEFSWIFLVTLVKIVHVQRLNDPYPPVHRSMLYKPDAYQIWAPFLPGNPLSDPGGNSDNSHQHYLVELIDDSKFKHTVKEGEWVIFKDADTGKVVSACTMNIRGEDVQFEASKCAPAAGQCTVNYGGFTHNEKNATEYCFTYNVQRTHPAGLEQISTSLNTESPFQTGRTSWRSGKGQTSTEPL